MNYIQSLSVFGIPKEQTLCFTGHRPEKLPKDEKLPALLDTLYYYIDEAVRQGYRLFLDGMADGIDYLAAEYLFRKREEFPDIRVAGIQPCVNYEEFFQDRNYDLNRLHDMQQGFDGILCLDSQYCKGSSQKNDALFRKRNCFLVDHSNALIAVCSLSRSGSKQTFNYAKKQNLVIFRLEPNPQLLYTPSPKQWPVEKINF